MKCPLLISAEMSEGKPLDYSQLECGKDECGQWDKVSKQCYVLSDLELKRKILQALKNMGVLK